MRSRLYLMRSIHAKIGPETIVSVVSIENTSDMWLSPFCPPMLFAVQNAAPVRRVERAHHLQREPYRLVDSHRVRDIRIAGL